ncbi:BlaI/MecI/CopY family transcriptional regulator [Streptomyces adustus]|uniref:BlaI/MecI/CopY family transcriptional regulator n=1 Tax=Streptomyces adustus TaxID=1609272 RepID=UPI00371D6779
MSETTTGTTGLTSQYATQVAADLERNVKEQERLAGEIAALQEQLATMQQDHTVLVSIRQVLGGTAEPVETPAEPAVETAAGTTAGTTVEAEAAAVVPAPRKKAADATGTGRRTREARKSSPARAKGARTAGKNAAPKAEAATESAQRTLVDIVRAHLVEQREPRSAAEIATTLGQQHPERSVKTTVVRTTLEGLVAKSHAQRTKQGTSVYYSAADTQEPAAMPEASAEESA